MEVLTIFTRHNPHEHRQRYNDARHAKNGRVRRHVGWQEHYHNARQKMMHTVKNATDR